MKKFNHANGRMLPPAQAMLIAITDSDGGMTRAQILSLETHPDLRRAAVCIDSLAARGMIENVEKDEKQRRWMATRKGRAEALRYAGRPAEPEDEEIVLTRATPRQVIGEGTYVPTNTIHIRPGSDAAYQLPSRIGQRLVFRGSAV